MLSVMRAGLWAAVNDRRLFYGKNLTNDKNIQMRGMEYLLNHQVKTIALFFV